MFDSLVQAFADLKIAMEVEGVGDAVPAKLDSLNQQFVQLIEDWRIMSPDQQNAQSSAFIGAQTNFHFLAGRMLLALPEVSDTGFTDQTDSTTSTSNAATKEPIGSEASTSATKFQPSNSMVVDDPTVNQSGDSDSAVTKTNQRALQPMASLSYEDHSRVLDPVYSLRPITFIDEQVLNEIITCIHETMRRANEFEILVPNEVISSIIAFIHGLLDFTSQSMLSWRFADEPATLDSLIEFLQVRSKRILPVERGPTSVPHSSKGAGPSAPKKAKKGAYCPLCNGPHALIRCDEFKALPPNHRRAQIARLNLCENCLIGNHQVDSCSHGACRKCDSKHNSMLPCPPNGASGQ